MFYFTKDEDFKKKFKIRFTERCVEKYSRDPSELGAREHYDVLATMIRDYSNVLGKRCKEQEKKTGQKQLIYFSMEFLIGRMLSTNLYNLNVLQDVKDALAEMGIDYKDLEASEPDAGLGNGGLGRLAACFMDSIASLGLPGHGNTIRYEYGFFRQKIQNGQQVEYPDTWLTEGFPWEIRKPNDAVTVRFYGNPETYRDPETGDIRWRTANTYAVRAVPYDVPMIGYDNQVVNTLRLWSAEPSGEDLPSNEDFTSYLRFINDITHGLYPDDSTEEGKLLRLRQQYFLVSAGIQSAINREKAIYGTLDHLYDHFIFQLNDTHPILSIPEMMRILMDENGYGWDDAYAIVSKCFAFTNHTVMPEALEKWPCRYLASVCPRVYMIIEEINRRTLQKMRDEGLSESAIYNSMVIRDNAVNMCPLAIHVATSVNGVAALHTQILKEQTFKDLYAQYPEKFSNKTNGISHRRFLLVSNPRLSSYIESLIGDSFIKKPEDLKKLLDYKDGHDEVYLKLNDIKYQNKLDSLKLIKDASGMDVSPDSIFDTQIKRLHAYKRQLLNVFHIIYLYQILKADPSKAIYPHTYIFGAKAAPSYTYAKKIIELILAVSKTIAEDPSVSRYIKVAFLENYDVSKAQVIIPASDISEQISLAGKEASGTSNMKFMMNGAITLGTLDGANIEITNFVGMDNAVIFGMREEEVKKIKFENTYNPWDIYNSDPRVKGVIDSLVDGTFSKDKGKFQLIYDEIMYRNDEFMVLKDFASYVKACERIDKMYQDKKSWGRSCLINVAYSGWFSSDRTIAEYNRDIWHLKPIFPKEK